MRSNNDHVPKCYSLQVELLYVILLFALCQMIQKAELLSHTGDISSLSDSFGKQNSTNGNWYVECGEMVCAQLKLWCTLYVIVC